MSKESKLLSLLFRLDFLIRDYFHKLKMPKLPTSLTIQALSLIISMDLESEPNQDSKLMSLMKQVISLGSAISNSGREKKLISDVISLISFINSDSDSDSDSDSEPEPKVISLVYKICEGFFFLKSDSELKSLLSQILTLAKLESFGTLISLSPQIQVKIKEDRFRARKKGQGEKKEKMECDPRNMKIFMLEGEVPTHFHCTDCNGEKHEECDKAPVEVEHPLHPKHSLQLVMTRYYTSTRECYCCEEDLQGIFYCCPTCDFAMNVVCVEESPVFDIECPKWHVHDLTLFSNQGSLTCDICALTHSRSPFYICPPCGFVIHKACIFLPSVIKMSRHPHRISFTPSFDQRDRNCGVCQRKMDNAYGGYACTKGCSFAAHSKCATQSNVWDGEELEEVPEEIEEEEPEPFVRIRDGVIQHFSHQQHHLRLDENTSRDFDEDKLCQACITPVYSGNFYSCIECAFILHEVCANLRRRIDNPIHPHTLTLVGAHDGSLNYYSYFCSVCPYSCINGFFYKCLKKECRRFKLHVKCGTLSEPLVHESHMHPLFLTSKPGDYMRQCLVCKVYGNDTFNCIEDCEYSLCFQCATLPQEVRYKHDKHMLTLSYGEETGTMKYWCEVCEGEINPKERFYMCDEYCCVTLHILCFTGGELYIKPGSSRFYRGGKVDVLANNQHMSRPFCSSCKKRCTDKTFLRHSGLIYCYSSCLPSRITS